MITSRNRKLRVFLLFILCSFVDSHLCFRLLPNVFESGNAQAVDQLCALRASLQAFRPVYDPTVAHVDFNKASIQRLKNLYCIGSWGMMDHYNFADILPASDDRDQLEIWGEELRGKIVIVADVSTGSTDYPALITPGL